METLDEYRNELPEGTYIKVCVPVAVAAVLEILKKISLNKNII